MERRRNPFFFLIAVVIVTAAVFAPVFYAVGWGFAGLFTLLFAAFWLSQFAASAYRWRRSRPAPFAPGETVTCIASGETGSSLMNNLVLTNLRLVAEPKPLAVFTRVRGGEPLEIPVATIQRMERSVRRRGTELKKPYVRVTFHTTEGEHWIADRHIEELVECLEEATGLKTVDVPG